MRRYPKPRPITLLAAGLLALLCTHSRHAVAATAEPVTFPGAGPAATVTLSASFYRAAGARTPAMVLLHTCAGLTAHEHDWAAWFVANGYSALVVDSFGPRRVINVCNHPNEEPTPHDRGFDALGALAWLRARPDIDPAHVGVIGWSHGADTAIAADLAALVTDAHVAGGGFRAAIAMYPSCRLLRSGVAAPLMLLLGGADEWTPPSLCVELAGNLPPGGPAVSTTIYPGVTHEWDNPKAHGSVHVGNRLVALTYNAEAAADAHARVLAFLAAQMR
jgi:dienelactone hydrolase